MTPRRLLGPLLLAAVLSSPGRAAADPTPIAYGITLEDPILTVPSGDPLWVTADPYVVVRSRGTTDYLQCFGAGTSLRTTLATPRWRTQRLAVDRATGTMYVVSAQWQEFAVGAPLLDGIEIARTDCGTTLEVLHGGLEGDGDPAWDLPLAWRGDSVFAQSLLPLAPDGTLYLPTDDAIYRWSVGSPATPPALVASSDDFSAALLTAVDDPFDLGRHEVPSALRWRMLGGVAVDDGSLVALMKTVGVDGPSHLFHVAADGTVTLLWRLESTVTGLALVPGGASADLSLGSVGYSAALDAYVTYGSEGGFPGMALIPAARPEVMGRYPRPIAPLALPDRGGVLMSYVSGAGGVLYGYAGAGLQPITVDLDRVDVDGDGLRWSEEVTLGLDDRAADHDGDGTFDGMEIYVHRTDPADPASHPDPRWQGRALAVSNMLADRFPDAEPAYSTVSYGEAVVCPPRRGGATVNEIACLDGDGASVDALLMGRTDSPLYPIASPDRAVVALHDGPEEVWYYSPFVRFQPALGADRVERELGGGPFAVVDPSRGGCPFAGSPEDATARCARPDEGVPDGYRTALLGFEPVTEGFFVTMETGFGSVPVVGAPRGGRWMIAVTDDTSTEVIHDGRVLGSGWKPHRIIPIRGFDAFFVEADLQTSTGDARRWYLADHNLVPREQLRIWAPSAFTPVHMPIGGTYRDGIVIRTRFGYAKPNSAFAGGGGACTSGAGGTFTCGRTNTAVDPFSPDFHSALAQWVEVPAALQAGEIVLAGTGEREGVLHRLTQNGGVLPWLTWQQLRRLSGGHENPRWDGLRFRDLAMAADATKLCGVEPASGELPGRVWELTLDAERAPVAFRMVHESATPPPTACGYDDAGALHWAEPGALVAEGGARLDTGIDAPRHVERVDGRWVLIGDVAPSTVTEDAPSAEAVCIDDDGTRASLGDTVAVSTFGGLAYVLDSYGEVRVMREAHVCDRPASAPIEHFIEPVATESRDVASVWSFIYEGLLEINGSTFGGYVPWRVEHAEIVVRPDGLLVARPGPTWWGRGARPPPGLWRLRGTYYPDDPANRLEELDPRRRDAPSGNIMTTEVRAEAMVRVPGAGAWPEDPYEYLGLERPAPRDPFAVPDGDGGVGPGADGGVADDAGPGSGGGGCGCRAAGTSGGGLGAGVLLGLLAWVRRRRRVGH